MADFMEFVVPSDMDGERLDKVLALRVSRRMGRRFIEAGAVFVDGRRVKIASRKVRAGQTIRMPSELPPERDDIDWPSIVLHQDEHLVVVNKPHGVPAAPTPLGDRNTVSHEISRVVGRDLLVVHRIDHDTTGLMVLAKHRQAARRMTRAFEERRVHKYYLAVVKGRPEPGDIELPIARGRAGLMKVDERNGEYALTKILDVVSIEGDLSLLRLELVTGRTHQIRVHLSHIGHPVMGDRWYGIPGRPLMLHSWRMELEDEYLGNHRWTAPVPGHWADVVPPGAIPS